MKPEPSPSEPRFDPRQLPHLLDEIDGRDHHARSLLLDCFLSTAWAAPRALSQ